MAKVTIRRLGYALGAQVTGVDLTKPLDDATFAEIYQAWLDYIVLCFPGQDLTPAQQMAFCSRFPGELDLDEKSSTTRLLDTPAVTVLASKPITVNGKGYHPAKAERWHSDRSFAVPAIASCLNAKALPDVGGDTMFANMYMAYDTLSPAFQRLVESLESVQDFSVWPTYGKSISPDRFKDYPPVTQPLVRVHPETGRKALYVGGFMRNIAGLTEEESRPLMEFLDKHATRYEFVYRHRYAIADLVIWDNRCAMHCAVADFDPSQLRHMQRVEMKPSSTQAAKAYELAR